MKKHPALRTAVAVPVIAGATAVVGPAVTVLSLATARRWHRTDVLPKTWCRTVLKACGVTVAVAGLDRFDPRANYVMVANHQSHLDGPTIITTVPQKVRFVAKRSLFFIPFFGPALWAAGNIPVNRSAPGSAARKIDAAKREVGRKLSVLFFPEGTRSGDGRLLPFKKGAAAMAIETGVPVLPLAVAGTRDALPKGIHLIRGGTVGIAFGAPIPTAGRTLSDRDALTAELRAAVERLMVEADEARRRADR